MLTTILTDLFERDLTKLKDEIAAFENETDMWLKPGKVPNSAGNLALHLCGNLQHFFGAVLGNTGYVRDRDSEFTRTGVTRIEILDDIDLTLAIVNETLAKLSDGDLAANYPIEVFGKPMTTGWFLTHLATHLSWHYGQIYYLRRLV